MPTTEQTAWKKCIDKFKTELSGEHFNTWILPLQLRVQNNEWLLLAPNQFVVDWVNDKYKERIIQLLTQSNGGETPKVLIQVGSSTPTNQATSPTQNSNPQQSTKPAFGDKSTAPPTQRQNNLNQKLTLSSYVIGKSNQLATAAAQQVAQNPGTAYNPLFIYGGVGLGKTHLMQAVGNIIQQDNPSALIRYIHSERYVADMVKALQTNQMDKFKQHYRGVDVLLIDDIQFFAGKERSQEEFFHTFNALVDEQQQLVMTCDKYPKEINGLEERLKSRFGWGLTVSIEPPELETRVAILMSKAELSNVELPDEVAFFIAKRIQSNVRELEGALKRVIANAHFTGQPITLDFTRTALKDLLAVQAKLVSIENIQKTVSEYYKIKMAEILSKRRSRFLARARQVAMALSKELTNHSLPEIGDAFGGRDHTTVLHACRKVKELMETHPEIKEDYMNLLRTLST